MAMPKFKRLIAISLFSIFITSSPTVDAAEPYQITVMSRNIYLGADVGVALELIPNFPKAAQFMWDQVKKTDFAKRAPQLAKEAARIKPDVIGIQEATIWYCKKDLLELQYHINELLANSPKFYDETEFHETKAKEKVWKELNEKTHQLRCYAGMPKCGRNISDFY